MAGVTAEPASHWPNLQPDFLAKKKKKKDLGFWAKTRFFIEKTKVFQESPLIFIVFSIKHLICEI